MKKNRILKGVRIAVMMVIGIIVAVLKTAFIDLFKNIKQHIIFAFKPEEKMRLKNELKTEKKVELIEERLGVAERLLYSIFNDPEYTKRDEGKYDLKQLSRTVKK